MKSPPHEITLSRELAGTSVIVAGAGLAGLTAAYHLQSMGAEVTVVDARERVGGRVWTIRDGFAARQSAEAGGDMIDEQQHEIRALVKSLGLTLTRILRGGFGYIRLDSKGRPQAFRRANIGGWDRLAAALAPWIARYRTAEQRWDSPIAADIARRSVAQWLDEQHASEDLRATATGLRGFFLADPDELSLVALVDQFASDMAGPWTSYRIAGGNDRLPAALAAGLGDRVRLGSELVAVSVRGSHVHANIKHQGAAATMTADYLVFALPATLLRRIPILPALPTPQHQAIAALGYGRATKTLLQFDRRFWRSASGPRAFGSPLFFGALWDGNENQPGKPGILSLLAGGGASTATQAAIESDGLEKFAAGFSWLGAGPPSRLIAARPVVWETDRFARGGYAFFGPTFDPALREWLARPAGRLFFAGEHTSIRWQGYMNGAVESGHRAALEILATAALGPS